MSIAYKKVTSHGSISIPVVMRRGLGIEPHDPMEVEEHDGEIRIRPYIPRCVFCGVADGVVKIRGKGICGACAAAAYGNAKGGDAGGTGAEGHDE